MFTDGKNLEKTYFEHFKWFHEWFLKKKKRSLSARLHISAAGHLCTVRGFGMVAGAVLRQ